MGYDAIDALEAGFPNTDPLPQPRRNLHPDKPLNDIPLFPVGQVTLSELNQAIHRRLKRHKSPGPDDNEAEYFKFLPERALAPLLHTLQGWWSDRSVPPALTHARVISLFKKGDPKDPVNYRPISLLNSTYKIYALILRNRLTAGIELILGPLQFGFRSRHSTAEPIFCLRRILAYLKRGDGDGFILFLDWEKAFDKIYHFRIWESLARFGVPDALIHAVLSLYDSATFSVTIDGRTSSPHSQRRGIRQGCPLSPFSFITVMAALIYDTQTYLTRTHGADPDWIFHICALLYADDTAFVASSSAHMTHLLHALETVAARYGLSLNQAKCVWMASGLHAGLTFRDGTPITRTNEATHLGSHLNIFGDQRRELSRRLADVRTTWQRLAPFWRHSTCPTRTKLQILATVIEAKLLYSTPSMWLSDGDCRRLDAFMFRTIRQILKYWSTFVDRTKTNVFLLAEASRRLDIGRTRGPQKRLSLFSDTWKKRRRALLLHVIRSPPEDPMRRCTFLENTTLPLEPAKKRVGRPRLHWTIQGLRALWHESAPTRPAALPAELDPHDLTQSEWLTQYAFARPAASAPPPLPFFVFSFLLLHGGEASHTHTRSRGPHVSGKYAVRRRRFSDSGTGNG